MHDFRSHSQGGLVVKMHSPRGLKCDSHMQKCLKSDQKEHLKKGYGWDVDG